ncbi:MAG: YggS family pyridoxal phosphate-dependent enzyme [Anaerovoracaceae bacterium]
MGTIAENIESIQKEKAEAAERAGRNPEDILLCAVTKTHTAEEINEAIRAGVTDIGENKVQEILDKYDKVLPVRWHMIGHLQTNKVKYIIDKVCLIHSVDSFRLAEEINRRAAQHGIVMDILVQVNAACDEAKFGVDMDAAEILVREILENCSSIRVRGLMTIAPYAENPEEIRPYFHQMRQLYDRLARDISHPSMDFKYLSMGMSNDRIVAVEEGSTVIRVGTAIFGARSYT